MSAILSCRMGMHGDMDELIAGIDRQSLAEAGRCQSGVTAIRRQPVQSYRVRDQRRRNPVGPHTATGPISNPWDFRGILDNRRSSSAQREKVGDSHWVLGSYRLAVPAVRGRSGAIVSISCRRGPDHNAGGASISNANA